jgi:hypothetical protein
MCGFDTKVNIRIDHGREPSRGAGGSEQSGDLPPLAAGESRTRPASDRRASEGQRYVPLHDGRHRFLAYVLAEREEIPIVVGTEAALAP